MKGKAAVWRFLTCIDGEQRRLLLGSDIYWFWADTYTFIERNYTKLRDIQARCLRFATDFLTLAQLHEHAYMQSCADAGGDRDPDLSILHRHAEWRNRAIQNQFSDIMLPLYVARLFEERFGRKRGAPPQQPYAGGGSDGDSGGRTKKSRSEKRKGDPIRNDNRNVELAKKLLEHRESNRSKLAKALPKLYSDGDIRQHRCFNYDIAGVCHTNCPRVHTPASRADYTKIWEEARKLVGS